VQTVWVAMNQDDCFTIEKQERDFPSLEQFVCRPEQHYGNCGETELKR
jgi:hypothetical protein